MKRNHAIACLRQICCSGLRFELVASEFLRVIPMIISSSSNTLSVFDKKPELKYHLTGCELGDMATAVPELLAGFHTPERLQRAGDWFNQHKLIVDPRVMDTHFYRSDIYNLIFRRFDIHHVLWAPVSLDSNKIGVVGLHRTKNKKPFNIQEQMQLLSLLPYLAHANQLECDDHSELSPSRETGMLILDIHGQIVYQSAEGKKLLQLAALPRMLIDRRQQNRLLLKLKKMCNDLLSIYQGRYAPPPTFFHSGPYGVFKFQAYWLDKCNGDIDKMIGVTIELQEPLTLTILRSMREFPLSPVQMSVALLIIKGVSFEQIGQQLAIKPSTVKDHAKNIYTKLGINQRMELLPRLIET